MMRSSCLIFFLIFTVSGQTFAQNVGGGIDLGLIPGLGEEIGCSRLPNGKLALTAASGKNQGSKVTQKKANKTRRSLSRNLKKATLQTKKLTRNIKKFDRVQEIKDLPVKEQNRILRTLAVLRKARLETAELETKLQEITIEELQEEIARLKEEVQELKKENRDSKRIYKKCKGCDDGSIDSFLRSAPGRSQTSRARNTTCGCFMKVIPSTIEFRVSNYPGKPHLCTAAAFVSWSDDDDAGATAWNISYDIGPVETRSQSASPPFDDVTTFDTLTFQVSGGSHWARIATTGKQGGVNSTVDCEPYDQNHRSALANSVVEITACPENQ